VGKGTRRLIIAAAGLAAGGLAWFAPPEAEDPVAPAARVREPSKTPGALAPDVTRLAQLPSREPIGEMRGEPFASRSWAPPAPKPAAAPPPVAPPSPYAFAGKIVKDASPQILLLKGERVFEAKEGETLEGGFKVESLAEERIVIVHVQTGTKTFLPMNSALATDTPVVGTAESAPPPMQGAAAGPPKAPPGEAAGRARLRWEGPERVRAGASFNVALRVSYDGPLGAAPMQLRFEPGVLEPLAVRAGKFLGQGGFSYRTNADGSIFVGATAGGAPGADAELLVLTFRPLRAGATAEVNVASLDLQGAAGRAVAHEAPAAYRVPIQP
jgi:hypothetical protein